MPHRTPCRWNKEPDAVLSHNICQVCYGYIMFKGRRYCPYIHKYELDPHVQHLITADERYYCISQLRKLEELRQG